MLSAQGHRVVLVAATDGIMGAANGFTEAADGAGALAARPGCRSRMDELADSAAVLGVAKVVHLGYADSGHGPVLYPDPPDRARFVRADIGEAAAKLAALLRDEHADVLLSYDSAGGNGHRDHVRVHEVGARAADAAGSVRLLEATVPRGWFLGLAWAGRLTRLAVRTDLSAGHRLLPRSQVTYRVNVRRYTRQKQAALAAHQSQLGAGRTGRAFQVMIRLPAPVFVLLFGTEWLIEPGHSGSRRGCLLGARCRAARPGAVAEFADLWRGGAHVRP